LQFRETNIEPFNVKSLKPLQKYFKRTKYLTTCLGIIKSWLEFCLKITFLMKTRKPDFLFPRPQSVFEIRNFGINFSQKHGRI
jgi:hypothetical protein